MTSENRVDFEYELLKELTTIALQFEGVAASKNKLKFKYNKKVVAELFLEHLARVDSYVLGGIVYGGAIFECASGFNPPYKSNLFNEGCFSFISSGEQVKRFGNAPGGSVKTPDLASAKETCAHIGQVLKEFYIPKVLACITPTKQTIGDVLDSPDNYAYPAVFIHCAAKLGAEFTDKAQYDNVINSRKIIKDKSFDEPLISVLR